MSAACSEADSAGCESDGFRLLFDPAALASVTIVTGHYGVGKTNLCLNLALDAAAAGRTVVLADLDVVNPYFRSSDYREVLAAAGVRVVAPVFAGSTLDSPSVSGQVATAIEWAQGKTTTPPPGTLTPRATGADDPEGPYARPAAAPGSHAAALGPQAAAPEPQAAALEPQAAAPGSQAANAPGEPLLIVDAGGDDVGVTALGRFSDLVREAPYAMLHVVNRSRNLTQGAPEALEVLAEVETKSRLQATAIVNNTHLKADTDEACVLTGLPFATEVARDAGLPLACTTVPQALSGRESIIAGLNEAGQAAYVVAVYVRTPWE